MVERRKEQRWPTYLGGLIVSDVRRPGTECLIRNTSPSGARLVLGQAALLPDEFSLQIPHRKTKLRVRARWRRLEQIGVEAVPEQKSAAVDVALLRQLHRLEAHNAELARLAAELSEPPA